MLGAWRLASNIVDLCGMMVCTQSFEEALPGFAQRSMWWSTGKLSPRPLWGRGLTEDGDRLAGLLGLYTRLQAACAADMQRFMPMLPAKGVVTAQHMRAWRARLDPRSRHELGVRVVYGV